MSRRPASIPEAAQNWWSDIQGLTQSDGLTILLTTHYLEEADRLATRLAIIDHGRIVAEGTPEQLKAELYGDLRRDDGVEADDDDAAADQQEVESASERVPGAVHGPASFSTASFSTARACRSVMPAAIAAASTSTSGTVSKSPVMPNASSPL